MVTNRVDKILVGTGAQAATVAAATAGQYVALVEGEANNTPITDESIFQLVLRKQDGSLKYSDRIKGSDIRSVKLEAPQAVVEQEIEVTMDTPVAGYEYRLTIIDKSDKEVLQRRQDKRTYQVVAAVGETDATLAAKFEDMINGDTDAGFTATAAAGVLTIEAKPKVTVANAAGQFGIQHYLEVALAQVSALEPYTAFGTVVESVAPDFGSGTFPQVREMEADSAGYEGYLNRTQFPVEQYPYDSLAANTYSLLVIEFDHNYWSNSVAHGKVDSPITLVFASSGATTELEALFAAYL